MSDYQAKNWKNYPDTTTPIRAEDLKKIDNGVASALNNTQNLIDCMYPEYTKIQSSVIEIVGLNSLLSSPPYIFLQANEFDPKTDGLLFWRNGATLIPRDLYGFEDKSELGYIKVTFHSFVGTQAFQEGETLRYTIYKKPNQSGGLGVLSTSAVGVNMATSSFVLGTAEIPWET